MAKQKSWGGKRHGAGRKALWKSGPCKAVKLPIALVEDVVNYARQLDAGQAPLKKKPNQDAAPASDESWTQLSQLVDEKQELTKQLRHVRESLAKERRAREMRDGEIARLKAQLKDARSVLSDALLEHRKGIRKGVRIKDVESALLALNLSDLD